MKTQPPDALPEVEADPRAIFDAHGAETVDELVAARGDDAADSEGSASDVERALDGLDRVSTEPAPAGRSTHEGCGNLADSATGRAGSADADEFASDVFETVEDAPDRAESRPERTVPEGVDDAELVTAFEAAANVESAEGDLPDTVPFE